MKHIYQDILDSISKKKKLLAVLIDPDKMRPEDLSNFMMKMNASKTTHIFVGGSTVEAGETESLVTEIRKHADLPIIIFPGDVNQITESAYALLFLSLISGRNPDYLIGKHVEAVSKLRATNLEVIPTGYILIENGKETSVQKISGTIPMSRKNVQEIIDTAKAGELLGMKLIYLEAGSGAKHPINSEIIQVVKEDINIPLIVGGGIRSKTQLHKAYKAGADIVVIGTAFEDDESFFNDLE